VYCTTNDHTISVSTFAAFFEYKMFATDHDHKKTLDG
jgi:hypothetical protein